MANPARALLKQFLLSSPSTLLIAGIVLSFFDSGFLYTAARKEGVLHINKGIGLLHNYGVFSTVLGNSIFFYLARKYYDAVCSIRKSKAVTSVEPLQTPLSTLESMIRMEGKYPFLIYLLVVIGAIYWVSNVGFHVIGNPEMRWGHKVFDSPDHRLTFYASRLHNLYSWLVVLPFVGYVTIYTSIQLRRMIRVAVDKRALRYDLLNPDQRGGFAFIDKSCVIFNGIVAIVYVEITMHFETFERLSFQYISAYIIVTLLFIGINRGFLGDIFSAVKELKLEALNGTKERAYDDDKLSFEILKYCYERRLNKFSILNFVIKTGAILISGAIKLWPVVSKTLLKA